MVESRNRSWLDERANALEIFSKPKIIPWLGIRVAVTFSFFFLSLSLSRVSSLHRTVSDHWTDDSRRLSFGRRKDLISLQFQCIARNWIGKKTLGKIRYSARRTRMYPEYFPVDERTVFSHVKTLRRRRFVVSLKHRETTLPLPPENFLGYLDRG